MTFPRPVRHAAALAASLAAALAAAAVAMPAQAAAPPTDYTALEGLSEPIYQPNQIVREKLHVPMADGVRLYVEVVRPKGDGPYPVIMEASPYHGTLADRDGTRILPGPRSESGRQLGLTGYFAPRGYAVVMVGLRGTGRSEGCLDHLGGNDASDLKEIVEWAASRPWSNGKVGMTGHSYVGSTPAVAAAQKPEGLATIVPSAGLASMYDHQFQGGVPFFLQWAGPQWAYPYLTVARHLPPIGNEPVQGSNTGDSFGENTQYAACGPANSALTSGDSQLSGAYADWHRQRDWRAGARDADVPVFMVHGVNDNAARVTAMEWFSERRAAGKDEGDKIWLGQWNHGSGCCPTRRGDQWTAALHAWFDKHLAGRDVDTGPPMEVFLADGTFHDAQHWARTEVLTGDAWPPETRGWELHAGDGTLAGDAPESEGEHAFTGEARGGSSIKPLGDSFRANGVSFSTGPVEEDVVLAGKPNLRLVASTTAPRVHLIAGLYDRWTNDAGEPQVRRITEFAINPELRDGEDSPTPAVPGERYVLDPPGFTMAHHLRKGHELVLRVTTSSPDKAPTLSLDPRVTVFTGPEGTKLELPVVEDPSLHPDRVPLEPAGDEGPAAQAVSVEVTPTVPAQQSALLVGPGLAEFDVPAADNARSVTTATWPGGGDMDLYLERQEPGTTTWSTVVVGNSSAQGSEQVQTGRLRPGRYRYRLWSINAAPNTTARIVTRFFNRHDEPGPE